MPVSTDLPGKLDFLWYSRNDHTITLTFPSTLAGRTFEVQLEDVDDPITVSIATTDATFTVPALDPTAKQTQKQAWSFVETTGADTTLIGGTIKWGLAYDDQGDDEAFTVTITEGDEVTVSVSGSVALAAAVATINAALATKQPIGTYASPAIGRSGFAGVQQKIYRDAEDVNIEVFGTSIEDEATEWPVLFATAMAALHPTHTFVYKFVTVDGDGFPTGWGSPVTIQTGTGTHTVTFWMAAISGWETLSVMGTGTDYVLNAADIDLGISAFDMNEGSDLASVRARMEAWYERFAARQRRAALIQVLQNPEIGSATQTQRVRVITEVCATYGIDTVNVHDAFVALPDFATTHMKPSPNTVHPNDLGEALYVSMMLTKYQASLPQAAGGLSAAPASNPRPSGPAGNLLANALLERVDPGTNIPYGMTVVNGTVTLDTSDFETGSHSVVITTAGAAACDVYWEVPRRQLVQGKTLTFMARVKTTKIGAGSAARNRIAVNDGVNTVTSESRTGYGHGEWRWLKGEMVCDPAATRGRGIVYITTASDGLGTIKIDRVVAFRGPGFLDPIWPDYDGKADRVFVPATIDEYGQELRLVGDTSDRLRIWPGGIDAGPGNAPADTTFKRSGVNAWFTGGSIRADLGFLIGAVSAMTGTGSPEGVVSAVKGSVWLDTASGGLVWKKKTGSGVTNTGWFALADSADIAALASVYQPLDADLTAIAALATTTFGRSLLTQADAAAARTALGVTSSRTGGIVAASEADVAFSNTAAEQTYVTLATPTALAAHDRLILRANFEVLNNTGSAVNFAFKFKLGTTTVFATQNASLAASANPRYVPIEIRIALVSTSSERVSGSIEIGPGSSGWSVATNNNSAPGGGTAAEDLSTTKNAIITATMGTADANASVTHKTSSLELVPYIGP